MAEAGALFLKCNGADVKGDNSTESLGRKDTIEVVDFDFAVLTAREAGSGMATGRRQYQPIRIRKRIDKASPLIHKALVQNEVTEGKLQFFRPNPTGDGTTEQFYTIEWKAGRVASLKQILPETLVPASSTLPPLEEVTFVFHEITVTYMDGGITNTDSWGSSQA